MKSLGLGVKVEVMGGVPDHVGLCGKIVPKSAGNDVAWGSVGWP